MEIDPVCGMEVERQGAEYTSEYQGQTFYFCSFGCKQEFDQEPKAFVDPESRPADRQR